MKDYKLPRDKHLTLEARQEIEKCLDMGGITFKDIARRVGKSKTTISREVILGCSGLKKAGFKPSEIIIGISKIYTLNNNK